MLLGIPAYKNIKKSIIMSVDVMSYIVEKLGAYFVVVTVKHLMEVTEYRVLGKVLTGTNSLNCISYKKVLET